MKRGMVLLAIIAIGLFALTPVLGAQEAKQEEKVEHGFVGADGCKICHKSEAKGDQYGKWAASKHAQAFATLATDEAKAIAAKAGVEGNPQEADACLSCHVTAHGVKAELLGAKYTKEEGVGCESCHGAGADYKSKKTMEDKDAALAAGLVLPTEETCKTCHNEKSPTFKGFEFEKMLAQIAHPYPKEEATEK